MGSASAAAAAAWVLLGRPFRRMGRAWACQFMWRRRRERGSEGDIQP